MSNTYHPRAAEFLFYAGQVAERAGDLEVAAEIWMRIPAEYPQSNLLPRAVFLSGISHYRLGDYGTALDIFQEALNSPGDRSALYFWIGKTYQAMGEKAAAEISWREAVGIDPTGYYSERARDILLGREPFTPPLMYDLGYDPELERLEAEVWMRKYFAIPEGVGLSQFLVPCTMIHAGSGVLSCGSWDYMKKPVQNSKIYAMKRWPVRWILTGWRII